MSTFRRRQFAAAVAPCQAAEPDVPAMTPRDLRHTAASLAVSDGANVKAVQRMLGHASAAMTLDVYADLFDDDLDAVATALNDVRLSQMWAKRGQTPRSQEPRPSGNDDDPRRCRGIEWWLRRASIP